MSKRSQTDHLHTDKSSRSNSLTRRPIKGKREEDKEEDGETEPCSSSNLYPLEDLEKIKRETAQNPSEDDIDTEGDKGEFISNYCSLKNIVFLLISIFTLFFGISWQFHEPEKPAAKKNIDLNEFMSGVKNKFDGQDLQTFQILKTSFKRVLNENSEPTAPSIVTIITNQGAEYIASDLSIYIAQKLASDHYVLINQSVFRGNSDNLKLEIDSKIKSKFDNKTLNVAVVDRFHNMPIDAAMIFHSYCDHESAPFKRAIFLFIVHLNRKIDETSSIKAVDEIGMRALRNAWHDASDDLVDSLITRLTGFVVNIK